jgi:hypothetical protein
MTTKKYTVVFPVMGTGSCTFETDQEVTGANASDWASIPSVVAIHHEESVDIEDVGEAIMLLQVDTDGSETILWETDDKLQDDKLQEVNLYPQISQLIDKCKKDGLDYVSGVSVLDDTVRTLWIEETIYVAQTIRKPASVRIDEYQGSDLDPEVLHTLLSKMTKRSKNV